MTQHHEEESALTTEDINKLNASIRNTIVFVLIVAGLGAAGVYLFGEGLFPIFALFAVLIVMLVIVTTSINSMKGILKGNRKTVLKGTVTAERQERVGAGRGRRTNYYKTIGTHELQVDVNVHKRYPVGSNVEIHYALNGRMIPYVFTDRAL